VGAFQVADVRWVIGAVVVPVRTLHGRPSKAISARESVH
jgi:hypothetical protein